VRSVYRSLLTSRFFSVVAAEEPTNTSQEADALKTKGKVVVGGGSGFVGTEVCSLLRRKGYQVIVVSRSAGPSGDRGWITWENLQKEGLPVGTKAVVNVTGHNILDKFRRWNDSFKTIIHDSRVLPAKMLKEAIENTDSAPDAFVQVTGAGYYPFDRPEEIKEDFVVGSEGRTYFTNLVEDWERAATLKPEHPTRNVFVRAGVVLGRKSGLVKELYPPFFLGLGGVIGSGAQFMPWIHVKDLAGIILHSIENTKVEGVVNGTAPEVVTNAEFVKAFGAALGRPTFIPVPEFVFNLVFGEERAAIVLRGQKVVPAKAIDTGYKFRYPTIAEACREFSPLFYSDPDVQ